MAFAWKEHKDIWKGEGIYHLTFAVVGRQRLLGALVPLEQSCFYNRNVQRSGNKDGIGARGKGCGKYTCTKATVDLSPLGLAVSKDLMNLGTFTPGVKVCAKQIMPDHILVVMWVTQEAQHSIRQVGNGIRIGVKRKAKELGVWPDDAGHVLEIPYIRTLVHKGQLDAMIDYVHANPDCAWERHINPELYTIRSRVQLSGLHFDMMGKSRLLDYPDVQVIALSRSLTQDQIFAEVAKALGRAETGAITYTAAMNDGEKAVSKAIREKGFPLVVMMLDGFPPEGSESARYFHPSGVYHTACGQGRLLLLAPISDNYNNPELISLTDAELSRKAAEKGFQFFPIPHDSKRWRMIAGNVMLRMIADTRKRPLP